MAPSPARRKSIAVPHHGKSFRPSHKRRPHSITPGDAVLKQLSPAARARRSLGPRKSILKPSPDDTLDVPSLDADSQNTTRKSFGRRVSFANHAHVRLFEKERKSDSSPDKQPSSGPHPATPGPSTLSNENDYPGASSSRRRSSIRNQPRFSEFGEASMDIDSEYHPRYSSPLPPGFLDSDQSAIQDEDLDGDLANFDDEDDMELTMAKSVRRRRSSAARRSFLVPRAPLAEVPQPPPEESFTRPAEGTTEGNSSSMEMSEDYSGDMSAEQTQHTEFTVPLNKSLRKPEPPSEAWLALRAMTHSGDTPYEAPPSDRDEDDQEEDMDLTEAHNRLQAYRESLGLTEDSFSSSNNSSLADNLDGGMADQTLNITHVMRQSLAGTEYSSMDLTTNWQGREEESVPDEQIARAVSPEIPPLPPHDPEPEPAPTPTPASASNHNPPASTPAPVFRPVFKPPPANSSSSKPKPLSTAAPARPVFSKPGPVFSAPKPAPRKSIRPPSPSKSPGPSSPRKGGTAVFAPPIERPQPKKRPAADSVDSGASRPNPAKPPAPVASTPKAQSPSPSEQPVASTSTAATRLTSTSGMRRPSGYFAQRKSLGASGLPIPKPGSPKKKAGAGLGRASVGSVAELDPEMSATFEREMRQTPSPPAEEEPSPTFDDIPHSPPSEDEAAEQVSEHLRHSPGYVRGSPMRPPPGRSPGIPPRVAFNVSPVRHQGESDGQAWQSHDGTESRTMDTMEQTELWRSGVQPPSYADEDEGPPISIEQFFTMTGIRFMDELKAPRRSTIHPSQLQSRRRRSSLAEEDVPLASYVVAMSVDVPQLELYARIVSDLQEYIELSKENYRQAEEEAAKCTPSLFREYSAADEEVKEELLHQLTLIRENNRATAKEQWYVWRLRWVEQLLATGEEGFSALTEDAKVLESIISEAQGQLPALREEHERAMKELEQEKAIVTEIEGSDQDYLNELQGTIAEQSAALDSFRTDVAENNAKLERMQEKLDGIECEKKELSNALAHSQELIHKYKHSTGAEMFRLKDELTALEELHLWRTEGGSVNPDQFTFVYASRFRVTVPCVKFRPVLHKIRIARTKDMATKFKDDFPQLTELSMQLAEQHLAPLQWDMSIRHVVQTLGDLWSGCAQIRTQFMFLAIKYPLTVTSTTDEHRRITGLNAVATVLLPRVKGKIYISFALDADTLVRWPMTLHSVVCQVKRVYGSDVAAEKICRTIQDRILQATPDDNHACILDACIEATEEYA